MSSASGPQNGECGGGAGDLVGAPMPSTLPRCFPMATPAGPGGVTRGGGLLPSGRGCSTEVVVGSRAGRPERGSLRGTSRRGVGYPIGAPCKGPGRCHAVGLVWNLVTQCGGFGKCHCERNTFSIRYWGSKAMLGSLTVGYEMCSLSQIGQPKLADVSH